MSSDYDVSNASAGSHGDVHENSTDQNFVTSGSDGLVPSGGSHMGSVSVDSIYPDSITDPLMDGFVDQPQQERGGGGLNLAVETEILGSEVGTEDPIINSGAIGEERGLGTIPKGRSIAHNIFDNQNAVFLSFDIEMAGEIAGIVQISAEIVHLRSIRQRRRMVLTMPVTYYERKTPSTGKLTQRFVQVQNTGISTVYLCMASSQSQYSINGIH
jgi:hypothetical protein